MGLFNKLSEPVFLKESSSAQEQLEKLKELEPSLNEEGQAKLQQDMKYIKYGIEGERNIIFELKNSHMPMYIIHDLYLRDGDLTSQIDFLVVTRKLCFVIECKNLYGDIEIDSQGAFVRSFDGQRKKEGIYSPITQNQRQRQYGSQKSGSQSGTASIEQLIKDLRVYRWNTSQDEGIKPYLVFTDIQMKDLIDKFPANSRELKKVSGFGDIKVQKYGKEILAILDKYRGRHL